jgi:hypothetical protein
VGTWLALWLDVTARCLFGVCCGKRSHSPPRTVCITSQLSLPEAPALPVCEASRRKAEKALFSSPRHQGTLITPFSVPDTIAFLVSP